VHKWLLSKKQWVVCTALALLASSRTKVLRPHPPGEMPVGTDRVKSAACPTNVKEVMARFVPRPGKALVHGLVSGGACGHTMVGPYTGGTRSLGHSLRQPYRPPGGQSMAAAPVETRVVEAFLPALAPVELEV
jgi:hypothetical protein